MQNGYWRKRVDSFQAKLQSPMLKKDYEMLAEVIPVLIAEGRFVAV